MTLSIGTRLGPHEILAVLGVGGMGEVYRARDMKLHRDVAIKILREAVAHDPDRLARFEREAQILASLNHPNIGHIYGLEDAGDMRALVMELVEGPTLADRIAHGPIPVHDALPIARQIAEGLEAAHERGIVHRDLKPANVKVRDDGTVKVLDFGLAKMGEMAGVHTEMSNSPTLVASLPGTILGTAAYMSPEQAKGKPADGISDAWAFGCVLYEMLAGRPAFNGETLAEIFGEVLKSEPEWNRLPAETPAVVRSLLKRCLQKDRKRRVQHIGDARVEIEEAIRDPHPRGSNAAVMPSRLVLALATLGVVGLIATTAGITWWAVRNVATTRELRLDVSTPPSNTDLGSVAISPDAGTIAFVATSDVGSQLWIRRLDTGTTRPLAAAALATSPFWSPDSRSIAFFAEGKLKRIDIESGAVQTLANTAFVSEGSWSSQGDIVFRPSITGPLSRIAGTGGQLTAATRLTGQQVTHSVPRFLPDGRHFLFSTTRDQGIHVGDLETRESRRLLDASATPVYLSPGYLLFVREGTLFGQPFDTVRMELTGTPSVIAQQVIATSVSASTDGTIVYRRAPDDLDKTQLTWVDRFGRELRRLGSPLTGRDPSISPDGQRVTLQQTIDGNADIYIVSTDNGRATRLTFDPAPDYAPIWSSDGSRIVFRSNRGGIAGLYEKPASGSGAERLLVKALSFAIPNDWSRDGRFLLFHGVIDERMESETLALAMHEQDAKPVPLTEGPRDEGNAQFSSDAKWIAYQSDEAGRFDVYVQPFTPRGGVTGKRQVSLPGGTHFGGAQPRWGKGDKELYYVSSDGWLMAAPIALGSSDQSVEIGVPVPLFLARIGPAVQARSQYLVSSDGQQFLMNIRAFQDTPVSVILNWRPKAGSASQTPGN